MTSGTGAVALRGIGTLFGPGTVAGMTDAQLLGRFLTRRDEGAELAFAALVARHGPMVLGVCRRALPDPGDADDAFQATFLVLARRAGSVRVGDSLGRWLYGVSRKVAARARLVAARRPRADSAAVAAIEARPPDPDRFEVRAILDEELARLPEPYRSAVVLCDLDGLTHEEAARDLRCPVGTVKSRQARGRARLRERLERRGLAPLPRALAPVVPAALADSAARSALFAGPTAAGMVPASAALLAQEVLKAMTGIKLKLAAAAALSIGVAATGAGVMARGQEREPGSPASEGPARAREAPAPPPRGDGGRRAPLPGDLRGELGRARQRLSDLREGAGDLEGLALLRSQEERVARLEDASRRIDEILADTLDPPTGPARAVRSRASVEAGRPGRPNGAPVPPPRELAKVSLPDYVIEPPDIIVVEVLQALPGRPITGERLVKPDGKINLGFYGEVYVAGLTTTEVKAKVALHLRQYIDGEALGLLKVDPTTRDRVAVDPSRTDRVFVDVDSYNSKVYYVQGEVASPGRLPVTGNETVLDAIHYAGGLLPTADRRRIRLVRPAGPGEGNLIADLDAIITKGDSTTNYQLFPGDRLIVERDPKAVRPDPPAPADVEARLQTVERKLDEVLKALERLPKP